MSVGKRFKCNLGQDDHDNVQNHALNIMKVEFVDTMKLSANVLAMIKRTEAEK